MAKPLRVLLVEGCENDARRLLDELGRQGFEPRPTRADDLSSLCRALDEVVFDVVLFDCAVAEMAPLDAFEAIRKRDKAVPFIVIFNADSEDVALDALRAGARDAVNIDRPARLGAAVHRELETAGIGESGQMDPALLNERRALLEVRARLLDGLYRISTAIRADAPFDQIFRRVVQLVPHACRYRETAHARVRFDDNEYTSDGFVETSRQWRSDIVVGGVVRGAMEIDLRESRKMPEDGAWDAEIQRFLDELTGRIGEGIRRVSAEAKTSRLSTVLRAIRDVNRLIVTKQDPIGLVDQVCREIVSTRGLQRAWVFLNAEAPGGGMTLESGWGERFQPLADSLKTGALPPCCRRALETERVVVIRDPLFGCTDCPLASQYHLIDEGPSEALACAIRMEEKIYGFMCVSVSPDIATETEEEALLKEVSDDIAFALRSIEMESERSRVEADLKKEAMRRQVLMHDSRDGIGIFNQEHEVVEANQRFADMLGYTPEEVLTLHTWDFEAAMTEADIRAGFADLTRTSRTFETRHRRKDGTVYDVEVSASGASVGGEPMVFTVSRDITEKKKMQANLAQSDRLTSMGMLAAGVAHEINNPLAYVLYHLEAISKEIPELPEKMRHCRDILIHHLGSDVFRRTVDESLFRTSEYEKIAERFHEALDGTRRIRDIARSLSTFSRVERHQLVPIDLHYTIECAANMAFNEIKYRARFVKDFGTISSVVASEGRLSQVFLNLLINAAHAVEEGDVANNEIRVRTWQEGDEVCVEVRDTGSGIPKENLDRIYDPFFTTKSMGMGSGLGLTISRSILLGYDGQLDVESEEGKGTSFFIRLPVRQPMPKKVAPVKIAPAVSPVKGRVLVIDDEIGILKALGRILADHDLVTAPSGERAQEIIKADHRFDLILCDMMMPSMSGMEVHEWLVDAYPDLARQFVFITGGAFTPRSREYLTKVDNPCVNKPFDVEDLRRQVSALIASYRRGQCPPSSNGAPQADGSSSFAGSSK